MALSKLTKGEEEVMLIIWKINEPCTVGQIRDYIAIKQGLPKPAHSTVSTFLKNLVDKAYIHYKAYGKTHLYKPLISQNVYQKTRVRNFIASLFDNSPKELVSFLIKENNLSLNDLDDIIKMKK